MSSRNKFKCMDCGVDTGKIHEHYFVHTSVWLSVVNSIQGMLCISCLEKRLGRQLRSEDFTNCYISNPKRNTMSMLLLSRLQEMEMSYLEFCNKSEVLAVENTVDSACELAASLNGILNPLHVYITAGQDGSVRLEYDNDNPVAVEEAAEIVGMCYA
jgi:hypothetical protein